MDKDDLVRADKIMTDEQRKNAQAASSENVEQKLAFEKYYGMGEARSLPAVSKLTGRHIHTIELWSSKFRWVARVKERDQQAAEFLMVQKNANDEAKQKRSHIRLLDGAIGIWAKAAAEGKIQFKSVDDVTKLIRARWEMTQIDDRHPQSHPSSGQGPAIDLHLRNMDKGQLRTFLESTLSAIKRITEKPAMEVRAGADPEERMNLSVSLSQQTVPREERDVSADADVVDIDLLEENEEIS